MITLAQRVAWYAARSEGQRFPDSIPVVSPSGRWMHGLWTMGQDYRNTSRLYGAYPPRYLRRVQALFPRITDNRMLHLFSGSVPKGEWTRLDLSPARRPRPDILGSVYDLPDLIQPAQFRLLLADPPYTEADARRYGTPMVNRPRAFRAIAAAVQPGTHLVWLDTVIPMFRKAEWHWWGSITLQRSVNHRVRVAFFYTRQPVA